MTFLPGSFLSSLHHLQHFPKVDILLLLGLALFGGSIGGRLFSKIKIPQVVGYIVIGLIVGQSGLNIIDQETIQILQPFSYFALGLIGFMIGGELKKSTLARYGRQFVWILLFEGMTAFVVVTALVSGIGLFFMEPRSALATGLILGAIASATAPAATTDVLWEYKTRGPLTSIILGIVAMDDGLALLLFAMASSIAASLLGSSDGSTAKLFLYPLYDIGGAILLGVTCGLMLKQVIRKSSDNGKILAHSIGAVLIALGLARISHVDFLLAAMTVGVVITNGNPRKSVEVFQTVEKFTPPIYIVFFVLFGAKLTVASLTLPAAAIALAYLIGRTMGKMLGSRYGARISSAPATVQKYLPYCLFSQAGVAIGLSIVAGQRFSDSTGSMIVVVITATTFVVQLLGPPCVRMAVSKAGEVGLNITEEDLIRSTTVAETMDRNVPVLFENSPISAILTAFSASPNLCFPVTDKDKCLIGIITVAHIKDVLMTTELNEFLLTHDLMEPPVVTTSETKSVAEAQELMNRYHVEYLPVLSTAGKFIGIMEKHSIQTLISRKLVELQNQVKG